MAESIFKKAYDMGTALLDNQILKAKRDIVMNSNLDEEVFYAKTVSNDPSYSINTQGWKEKPTRLQNSHLKQISLKNSVVAAIIQTRQNQVATHAKLVTSAQKQGFMIKVKDEEHILREIKEELREGGEVDVIHTDNEVETYDFELERKAKDILNKRFQEEKRAVEQWVLNCGEKENRPHNRERWNFDLALRAWVRDSLTYDLYATEMVPDNSNKPHHWFPVDAGTIKFASIDLAKYKQLAENFLNLDLLYPEKQVEKMKEQKTLDLDETLLANDSYNYVQVIKGKIERAYTEDELKTGIRNMTTDIYNNGYGVTEIELCVGLITGHLNAEFYNQAYFTQGFSAKGILHIKASINRRKLESVRQQWQHMIRGSKNSFQTPIFAGVNEVKWIPLTQKHDDIGFEGWMRYLIKMICAVYQISPLEIGLGMADEGGGKAGVAGDATQEKLRHSKDKGLIPLITHLENYLNEKIIAPFDDRFIIEFTGIADEDRKQALERQAIEREFKKTVNEIRAEDGLPPLPGMDNFIAGAEYVQWYAEFSEQATEKAKLAEESAPNKDGKTPPDKVEDEQDPENKDISKSLTPKYHKLKVEYYGES